VGPVGPVGPVTLGPVGPVEPVGPVAPVSPVGPVGPTNSFSILLEMSTTAEIKLNFSDETLLEIVSGYIDFGKSVISICVP
jgi:hypothetical protein